MIYHTKSKYCHYPSQRHKLKNTNIITEQLIKAGASYLKGNATANALVEYASFVLLTFSKIEHVFICCLSFFIGLICRYV